MGTVFKSLGGTLLLMAFGGLVAYAGSPVPDTGQTNCYDTDGNVVNCSGTGQDGEFSINPQYYTKLGYAGQDLDASETDWLMVRDNVTGLIWERKGAADGTEDYTNPNDPDNTYTWYDSNSATNGGDAGTPGDGTDTEDFIEAMNSLNGVGYGGFDNWRLPTIKELSYLVAAERWGPAINADYFPFCGNSWHHSSSSDVSDASSVWAPYFGYGWVENNTRKSAFKAARAVRGDLKSSSTYLDNGDGTVTDTNTGLMWQKATQADMFTWQESLDYCNDLILAGQSDWRLPNRNELQSLVNYEQYDPAIEVKHFTYPINFTTYWSSSYNSHDTLGGPWCVGSYSGNVLPEPEWYAVSNARAVRGGQPLISCHQIIFTPYQASRWNTDAAMPITWDPAGISGSVAISLSRQGGLPGTFETITASTANDGHFQWTVRGAGTVNAALKIEPLSDPSKGTVQSLFSIVDNISIDPLGLTVGEPDDEATFTIKLNKAPSAQVVIDLTTTNPGEFTLVDGSNNRTNEMTVTLDGTNWQTGVDVTVRAESDNTPDGDQVSQVLTSTVKSDDPNFSGLHIANVSVTVADDQTGVSVESVYPAYGTVGSDLDVTVRGLGFVDGTTRVFITPSGGTEFEITPVTVDDAGTLRVTIPGPASAVDYDLKVYNSVSVTDVLPAAVSFAAAGTVNAQRAKKAIIVAGGGPFIDNDLWLAAHRNANHAYAALFGQGYEADSIQYLSPGAVDVTGDGANDVDDDATLSTLEDAIKNWSVNTSPAATDLMIYLVGPGRPGKFYLKRTEGYEVVLTASVLDGWLNTVKPSLTGDLILIVDAPASGGFLSGMVNSRPLVITGSTGSERSWYLDDGEISFSRPFWEAIFDGGELFAAFYYAYDFISSVQTPGIDATGDGTPDPRSRARSTDTLTIGRARAVETDPPIIGAIFPDTVIDTGTQADLWADVTADNEVSQVWARIYSPMEAVQSSDQPVLVLPTVKQLYDPDHDDRYWNIYEEFIYQGDYKIFIHASDKRENHAQPKMGRIIQTLGQAFENGDLDMDGAVTIADALIALRAVVDLPTPRTLHLEPTGDERIGVEDALLILQWVSGVRVP